MSALKMMTVVLMRNVILMESVKMFALVLVESMLFAGQPIGCHNVRVRPITSEILKLNAQNHQLAVVYVIHVE